MKKLILIPIIFISMFGYNQDINFQYGYNSIFDSLYLTDSDTLEFVTVVQPTRDFDWLYGVNYGDIDSTELILYIQGSINGFGWETISDTITIDSTNTERVFYLTGNTPYYPQLKFVF